MITAHDFYVVMSAVVPLYVAMILAYGSVRWWRILTPDQCGGINRFVAIFAVPLLSFQILAGNDPYKMNAQFVAADALQKVAILAVLAVWARWSRRGSFDWMITLFMLATLPNTLVMGIPLLAAMYGSESGSLVVQAVVLQCIIWYTLLLIFYEYRAARNLIRDQFPKTAASIVSFRVESDVVSLDGANDPIQADTEVGEDGKLHVTVRRSTASSAGLFSPCRPSAAGTKMHHSLTPRPSNLTGADIYSIHSSRSLTPRESSFNHSDYYSMMMIPNQPPPARGRNQQHHHHHHGRSPRQSNFGAADVYSLHSSRGPTPRTSNFNNDELLMGPPQPRLMSFVPATSGGGGAGAPMPPRTSTSNNVAPPPPPPPPPPPQPASSAAANNKDLVHMFVWSSSGSPISEGNVRMLNDDFRAAATAGSTASHKDVRLLVTDDAAGGAGGSTAGGGDHHQPRRYDEDEYERDDFSFGRGSAAEEQGAGGLSKIGSSSTTDPLAPQQQQQQQQQAGDEAAEMPAVSVMTRLILDMVWRKLVRNPNTYSSLLGLGWALVSFKWHVKMPDIVENSILILSKAGLGMAMFSLGLFMALQKRLLVCGTRMALYGMVVRFITGPAVMAATSIAVGLKDVNLHVSIVQAALPQGIVPFVFAKEYNVHPDVLSTAVIFGMLVAFPITMLYYVLLGL